jgi:tRNA dimethylallyltransferase
MKKIPILAVIGPTASGKSQLGVDLAKKLNGEIISSDSIQVYRHLNIGSAKPDPEMLAEVPHHLIDILNPDQSYNAGQFEQDADEVIQQLVEQKKRPIVLGGTGLYLRSLIHGMIQIPDISLAIKQQVRVTLDTQGLPACYQQLNALDPESAQRLHPNDISRIIRALEVVLDTGESIQQWQKKHQFAENRYPVFYVGIQWDRQVLYDRINQRVNLMMDDGLIEEVENLLKMGYSKDLFALKSIGYKQAFDFLSGDISKEEMIQDIQQKSRRYAKKQVTWWRSKSDVNWLKPNFSLEDTIDKIQHFLEVE